MLTSRADTRRGALDAIDRFVNSEPMGERVLLRPWQGPQPAEHVRMPVGEGVCGAALATGRTEVVDDVAADPRYLRCSFWTRSEIVVPISFRGEIVGEIDVDSDDPSAFGDEDIELLEHVARMISSRCSD